jgi:hypothetical protein
MGDFAYAGPEQWRAGPQLIRVENAGHQDHQIRLARLNPGKSVSDWMKAGDAASRTISGVARMGPGQVAYLPVELIPGNYVIYCLITDPGSGKPHLALGMFRAIPVL